VINAFAITFGDRWPGAGSREPGAGSRNLLINNAGNTDHGIDPARPMLDGQGAAALPYTWA
jgi:hypothetical protein